MWFPEKTGFDYSSENPVSLFIAFAWREFFEVTTPPCYKPNFLNTLHLIEELGDSAQRVLKDERWKKHLEAVLEELKHYAKQDKVLSTYFSNVQYKIESLEKAGVSPKILEIFSSLIKEELKDYEDKVRLHFKQAIDSFSKDSKKKEDMLWALQSLATLAVSQNLSSESCRSILNESHLSLEPCKVGQVILTALSPVKQQWGCVFALKGNWDFLRALTANSKFVTSSSSKKDWKRQLDDWKRQPDEQINKFLQRTNGYPLYIYQKDIPGKTVFQVFESSFGLLKRMLGVANLYQHSIAFEIAPYAFVENQDTKVQQLVSVHSGTNFPPSHKIAKNLLKELQNSKVTGHGHGFDQAMNSLEQYSLAHSTWDLKARFVHLWVALEALTGFAEKEGSIIGHLTTQITPIIVPHYLHSMVKYLAICLHEFGFCNSIENSTGGFTKSTKEQIRPDELLLALTRAHEKDCGYGEDIVGKLVKVVSPKHPLLGNHIFTACCKIFTAKTCSKKGEKQESEKAVKKILSDYKDSTEWQVQRIYRARNLLVHEGTAVPQLQYLFEQLNYYYSVTFSAVIDDVQKHSQWSVDHSFLHRRLNFERLLHLLNKSPSMLTVADVLPREEENTELLWPTPKPFVPST
jgi:hypothetical protein